MLLSSRRLTLTSGIDPPVKPMTSSRPRVARAAEGVGEAIPADRVDDDVDAAASRQFGDRLAESLGGDHLVGTRHARDVGFAGVGHHGIRPGAEALASWSAAVPIPPAAP